MHVDLLSTQAGEPRAAQLASAQITPYHLAGRLLCWLLGRCFWLLPQSDFGAARGLQPLANGTDLPRLVPVSPYPDALRCQGTTATVGDLGGITNAQVAIAQGNPATRPQ